MQEEIGIFSQYLAKRFIKNKNTGTFNQTMCILNTSPFDEINERIYMIAAYKMYLMAIEIETKFMHSVSELSINGNNYKIVYNCSAMGKVCNLCMKFVISADSSADLFEYYCGSCGNKLNSSIKNVTADFDLYVLGLYLRAPNPGISEEYLDMQISEFMAEEEYMAKYEEEKIKNFSGDDKKRVDRYEQFLKSNLYIMFSSNIRQSRQIHKEREENIRKYGVVHNLDNVSQMP